MTLTQANTKLGPAFSSLSRLLLNPFSHIACGLAVLTLLIGIAWRIRANFAPHAIDYPIPPEAIRALLEVSSPNKPPVLRFDFARILTATSIAPLVALIYSALYFLASVFPNPVLAQQLLFGLPGLLGFIGIGLLLFKYFRIHKAPLWLLFSILLWVFNYHFMSKGLLFSFDLLPLFLVLLALDLISQSVIASGILLALSLMLRPFPLLALPVFLWTAHKNKSLLKFLLVFLGGLLLFHLPIFIARLSLGIRLVTITVPTLRVIIGWVLAILALFLLPNCLKDEYFLIALSFAVFYALTPNLPRYSLVWWVPFLLIGTYRVSKETSLLIKFFVALSLLLTWVLLYAYLI